MDGAHGAHGAPATRIAKLAQLNCWVYCRYIMIYRSSWLGKTMPRPHRIADWQLGCTCQVFSGVCINRLIILYTWGNSCFPMDFPSNPSSDTTQCVFFDCRNPFWESVSNSSFIGSSPMSFDTARVHRFIDGWMAGKRVILANLTGRLLDLWNRETFVCLFK